MSSETPAARRDVIVLGGSAGALDALSRLLPQLPADLAASIIVTVHVSPAHRSRLAELLGPVSSLPVQAAHHGAPIRRGNVYVSVPDLHLSVDSSHLMLSRGPKEHFTRPAIDVLFRSAAHAYGARVTGVLLCGGGFDGTAGLGAIKTAGGITMVQDPRLTRHRGMLTSAIESGNVDHILTLDEIGRALSTLAERGHLKKSAAGD